MKDLDTFSVGQINILNKQEPLRRYKILAEAIESLDLDLITMQEVSYPKELVKILEGLGFQYSSFGELRVHETIGDSNSVAIFSKTPLEKVSEHKDKESITAAITFINAVPINIVTAHFAWGGAAEFQRLEQAEEIDRIAKELELANRNSITIFGGDLNATPNSRTVRYMTGYDLGSNNNSTLWLDAYATVGKEEDWITTDHGVNEFGRNTALGVGILRPEYIPARRIDYLMTHGWAYGKSGSPLAFSHIKHPAGKTISDHNGIQATFILK